MSTHQVDNANHPNDAPLARPVEDETVGNALDTQGAADDEEYEEIPLGPSPWRERLRGMGACAVSTCVHIVGLMLLSLFMIAVPVKTPPPMIVADPVDSVKDEELQEVELDPDMQPATEMTSAVASTPMAGVTGAIAGGLVSESKLDTKVVEKFAKLDNNISIEHPMDGAPPARKLITEVPTGFKGESRMLIEDYNQAFDMITQEIMWMLDRSDVLVVWCFDQSGSMKDDQKEIQQRVANVYVELGLARRVEDAKHLTTGVASYGGDYMVHTPKPTSNYQEIQAAIGAVPEDPSGKEMMCEAVGRSVKYFRQHAKNRQLALILVTDESGQPENNYQFLEATIAEAKAAECKIYTLGREAVFGYPYAYMSWTHPQTKRTHWLQIDRGPETGFPEQLQTNGFRRRYDAFGSGFGSYEQARMSRETGGIFFMLPSVETRLVGGHKGKYELEKLRAYRPDLRSRIEVFADRDERPMRTFLWKIISDLNPYNKQAARVVEMRMEFSILLPQFVQQAKQEQTKAMLFIRYLGEVQKIIEQEAAPHRLQEPEPRWQANYDLIYAQTVAYQARLYEYGVALEEFMAKPQVAPLTKSPDLRLVHWDIGHQKELRAPEKSQPYIDRATELFNDVIRNHPGTPWADRAKQELSRGFGIRLVPDYHRPYIEVSNPSPVPKL
ncbi:MAG: VWA domain-containing protein [Planctomycetales bacterium]|nr:VWA domain-containing protein [Planctomycetales bacterium]